MHDGMMGGPMMMMGFIVMILFLLAIVGGVVWLIRTFANDGRAGRGQSPVDQLESRYARGEIDRDEYFQRRNDLEAR